MVPIPEDCTAQEVDFQLAYGRCWDVQMVDMCHAWEVCKNVQRGVHENREELPGNDGSGN